MNDGVVSTGSGVGENGRCDAANIDGNLVSRSC